MDQSSKFHAVFDKDLLRDKIIGYAIQDEKRVLKSNIRSCRLVNKAWLQSVSRVFRNSQKPLFPIYLHTDSFSIGSVRLWNKQPDEILRETVECQQQEDHVPPYSIDMFPTLIHNDASYQMFLDCLTSCGSSLVHLNLPLMANPKPVLVNDSIFLLPRLKSLFIEYFQELLYDNIINKERRIDYIQRILDASTNLKSLVVFCRFNDQQLPDCLAHLTFPASITTVNFYCVMNDSQLELLARNSMPNLSKLKFLVNKTPFQDGLVSTILANVRKTLITLHVGESRLRTKNNGPTIFQLAVMEKLERIHIETPYFALGGMFFSPMEKFAPVLRHMVLTRQTHSMFRKWTENSCFRFVQSLTVTLVTDEHRQNGREPETVNPLNFDLRTMEILKSAFPNLLDLDITISAAEPTALVFIMKEMKNLLRLCIRTLVPPRVTSSVLWDSLLIGVPEERMDELTKFPELWKEMQVLYSELPSIRNLTDLQTLELIGRDSNAFHRYPLISKASFRYGFLQMPNLSKVITCYGDTYGLAEHNLDFQRRHNII